MLTNLVLIDISMYSASPLQFQTHSIPGDYGYQFEYLLVAAPSVTVHQQVIDERNYFSATYQEKGLLNTKPYIKVAKFMAKEAMEETIIRWMNRSLATQPTFSVMLNNFGGFPPHTIFVRVQNLQPFKQLGASLQSVNHYITTNNCPPIQWVSKPHLTIARRLSPEIFDKAMLDYSPKTFEASFTINQLVLLRRQQTFDTCKQLTSFHLAPSDKLLTH